MRSPRSRQNLIILHPVRLHHKDGLRRRRLLNLHIRTRTARARKARRTAAVLARRFRVDGDAVPAAEIQEELVHFDGSVRVVPE